MVHEVRFTIEVKPSAHVDDYSYLTLRANTVVLHSAGVVHDPGLPEEFIVQKFIEQQKDAVEMAMFYATPQEEAA